jgi:Ca2+-binding RTX toxin-like protein
MSGGWDNDTYVVNNTGDKVIEVEASGAADKVNASITYTLAAYVEELTLTGTAAIDGTGNGRDNILTGNSANNKLYGSLGNDTLYGKAGADSLYGNEGNDSLYGNEGNDSLYGNEGNDTLDGGLGADSLSGGLDNDTYVVDNAGDKVIEAANGGAADKVNANITYTLAAYVEQLTLTGTTAIDGTGNGRDNTLTGNSANNKLYGSLGNDTLNGNGGADSLYGNEGNDSLYGNEGNDTLDGGLGADSLSGGLDNDTYVVNNAGDKVIEGEHCGAADKVNANITYTLAAYVEQLTLTGAAAIDGTGNGRNNTLNGNSANNKLYGSLGNDTLNGNAGADSLYGNEGNDNLRGGEGNDFLYGGLDADILNGGAGKDVLSGSSGNDTFAFTAASDSAPAARDRITDFASGDKLDFSAIDANTAASGDQAFSFIGAKAFSAAGQLRYVYNSASNIGTLYGSTDADADAEFAVELTGVATLTATDLVL